MSKLAEMQARFQQKQMQEKEEKLLRLYENQQQRAFDRVGRGSAGSNTSLGSTGGGKVRQMFDERRQKAGVDKSYPLEPLKSTRVNGNVRNGVPSTRNTTSRTVVRSTVSKSVSNVRNGKPSGKTEVVQRIYNNNNGDESYEEHRFEDDNYRSPSFDLIEMMNRNNIRDEDLDEETLPQIGFDEVDEPAPPLTKPVRGKLSNVGGKLPSQNLHTPRVIESKPAALRSSNGVARKPATPASVKKPATTAKTTTTTVTPTKKSPSKTTQARSNMSQPVPNTARPSARQPPKQNPSTRDDLAECKICHRRFAEDRLAVHENICLKSAQSKRKKYDATKHRLQGTDLEQYGRKILKGSSNKPTAKQSTASKKDWRKTHEEFIAAIRSAKQMQAHLAKGGKLSDLPPPPPSSNPDYVQCPHCGRRFNESAAERHIPKCANYQYNKPNAPAAKTRNIRR